LAVYIHERIEIEGGGRGKLIEMIRSRWAPHLEREHGVRLVGAWATVGSTGNWPEVRIHWEMDDWEHFSRAQHGQYPMEERDVSLAELWNQAIEYRQRGHSMLLKPTAFSPDLAENSAEVVAGDVILHEDVRALPGRLPAYHAALAAEFLPLAEKRGLRLLVAYANALQPGTGLNLWVLRDWDHWRELMEATQGDAELRAWNQQLGAWLEDLDGFLAVRPPGTALRT
jgi:hypothetical protein